MISTVDRQLRDTPKSPPLRSPGVARRYQTEWDNGRHPTSKKAAVCTAAPETRWVPTVGRHTGYLVISTSLVSRRNRPPITTDISAMMIGYHNP